MTGQLYVAGEHIRAGDSVILAYKNSRLYRAGSQAGTLMGDAMSDIREGFRARVDGRQITEDDA
jgi:predicted transcriptional regulator